MQNGIRHLRAIKIWYRPDVPVHDQWHGGMRDWVENWLPEFERKNPDVKVDVVTLTDPMEMTGDVKFPRMSGYYLNGTAMTYACKKFDVEAINMMVHEMRNTCNDCEPRPHQHAVIETHTESIQGRWTPYLWMSDTTVPEEVDHEDVWKKDIKDIAKYVRLKKEHREAEFEKQNYVNVDTRRKMETRWAEQVFPYTVGAETTAVPGRLFLEETKTLFPESGQTPGASRLEHGGGGFMGGFTRPYSKSELSTLSNHLKDDDYGASTTQAGGTIPPFAGAPFSEGYDKYENFWKNWDLFNHTSSTYRPPLTSLPNAKLAKHRAMVNDSLKRQMRNDRQHRQDNES
eukprot:TRINITY_DN4847_c0_g2_i5.p1 TRINITY_DN4847_c0_g2~~TRINITY_DN4847_c0_g2_i5.p1  ORF type:complete len:360 (+),score=78.10 TRINITY_DN4847_c0_g2_i5:52-1080(+)